MDTYHLIQSIQQLDLPEQTRQFWLEQIPKLPKEGLEKLSSVLLGGDMALLQEMDQKQDAKIEQLTSACIGLQHEIQSIEHDLENDVHEKDMQTADQLVATLQ